MVVSMRPLTPTQTIRATRICAKYPARPRRADPLRRPGRDRHPRSGAARLRRPGRDPARRAAGVLGVRRHAAGGADASETALRHHAQAGAHVPHRPARPGPGNVVRLSLVALFCRGCAFGFWHFEEWLAIRPRVVLGCHAHGSAWACEEFNGNPVAGTQVCRSTCPRKAVGMAPEIANIERHMLAANPW